MSTEDAQNTFQVNPNLMIEGYTQRLANVQQNEVRLEAAVNQLMTERAEHLRQIEALQAQVDVLSVKDEQGTDDLGLDENYRNVHYADRNKAMVDGELRELKKAQE
jgi:hypothetical protein